MIFNIAGWSTQRLPTYPIPAEGLPRNSYSNV